MHVLSFLFTSSKHSIIDDQALLKHVCAHKHPSNTYNMQCTCTCMYQSYQNGGLWHSHHEIVGFLSKQSRREHKLCKPITAIFQVMLFERGEANRMTQEDTEGDHHGFWVYKIVQPHFGGMKVHLKKWRWWIGQMTDEIFGENGHFACPCSKIQTSPERTFSPKFWWISSPSRKKSKSGSLACGSIRSISSSTIRAMSRKPTSDGEPSGRQGLSMESVNPILKSNLPIFEDPLTKT